MDNCQFCNYFNEEPSSLVNSPWLEDDEFCAIVSKGAMIAGWSLICPKDHCLNLVDHYGRQSLWQFSDEAASLTEARYGQVSIFEHGAGYRGSPTGCGTNHAHLHIVPLPFDLVESSLFYGADLRWIPSTAAEISHYAQGEEYLFVASQMNGLMTSGMLAILEQPVSQFFRRVIANQLGCSSQYDYNMHPMWETAERTAYELRADAQTRLLKQHGGVIPGSRTRLSVSA